ncbi:MAG: hypothetical protein J5880_02215 [Bacilli bacterium]|nr:hypothetical protein [Bacilli bacterium]
MRRQRFWWTFLVGGLVCTFYGGFTLIYHLNHGNGLKVHALILLILGVAALGLYLILLLLTFLQNKKKQVEQPVEPVIKAEEKEPEPVEEVKEEKEPKPAPRKRDYEYVREPRRSGPTYTDAYVKKVGYGPVLRFFGNQILDMRTNTYYRFQDNYVYRDGGGVAYEISNKRIRNAFGGYLYELSGSNINKTYGGFFASVSGNYISKFDNSERYETGDSLTSSQLLMAAVLLFGE